MSSVIRTKGDEVFVEAMRLDQQGQTEEAINLYLNAIETGLSDENVAICLTCLGSSYRENGELKKSHHTLTKANQIFPNYLPVKVFLALTEAELGNVNKAVELLLLVIYRTSKNDDLIYFRRAIEYYSKNF